MPGLKGGMDDGTRETVDRLTDALFEIASSFGRLADALEAHTALMADSGGR